MIRSYLSKHLIWNWKGEGLRGGGGKGRRRAMSCTFPQCLSNEINAKGKRKKERRREITYPDNIGECDIAVVSILIDKWIHKLTLEGWVLIANY